MTLEKFEQFIKKYRRRKLRLGKWSYGRYLIPTAFSWSKVKGKKPRIGGKLNGSSVFKMYDLEQDWKILDYAHNAATRIMHGRQLGYSNDEIKDK